MKDIYTQYNVVLAEVDEAGKRQQFDERSAHLTSVEAKLNCARFVLGVKAVKESTARITKKNGGAEWFTESAGSQNLSEAKQLREKSDEVLYKGMGLNEADKRKLKNLPPVGVTLTSTQLREFRHLRSYRINEVDAVRLALKVA